MLCSEDIQGLVLLGYVNDKDDDDDGNLMHQMDFTGQYLE